MLLKRYLITVLLIAAANFTFAQIGKNFNVRVHTATLDKFRMFGKLALQQNIPDPFFPTDTTYINYRAEAGGSIAIVIYDVNKNVMFSCKNLPSGTHTIVLFPQNFTPGIYFYALIVNGRMVFKEEMNVIASFSGLQNHE